MQAEDFEAGIWLRDREFWGEVPGLSLRVGAVLGSGSGGIKALG